MKMESLDHHDAVTQEYNDDFICIDASSSARFRNYRCHKCEYTFNTSLASMIAHSEAHRQGAFIKISKVSSSDVTRCKSQLYRPEEHYFNANTGQYQRQGDMEIFAVIIPESYNRIDNSLACRKCNAYAIQFFDSDGQLPAHICSRHASLLTKHEVHCRSNN